MEEDLSNSITYSIESDIEGQPSLEDLRKLQNDFLQKRKKSTVPKTLSKLGYWKKVFGEEKEEEATFDDLVKLRAGKIFKNNFEKKILPANISFQEARRIFYQVYFNLVKAENPKIAEKNYTEFYHAIKDNNLEFSQIINNCILHAIGQEGEYDLKKGLYFYGLHQTGKTTLLKSLQIFNSEVLKYRPFKIANCGDLVLTAQINSSLAHLEKMTCGAWGLDDIGRENEVIIFNRIDIVENLLFNFEERFKNGLRLYATSNFIPEKLKNEVYAGNLRLTARMDNYFEYVKINFQQYKI